MTLGKVDGLGLSVHDHMTLGKVDGLRLSVHDHMTLGKVITLHHKGWSLQYAQYLRLRPGSQSVTT